MGRTRWQEFLWVLGERLAESPVRRLVLRDDGPTAFGRRRYVNRINRHSVVI